MILPLAPNPGDEVEPGVFLERRRLVFGGLAAVCAALLSGESAVAATPQDAPASRPSSRPTSPEEAVAATALDRFLVEALDDARAITAAARPDEEAYLARIAARLLALPALPTSLFHDGGGPRSARAPRGRPLVVMQFRLAPGKGFKLHDHRDYNGVLCGLEGAADCRNFDFVDAATSRPATRPAAKSREFLIRETVRTTLKPGVVSTLSRTRDNLHEVTAGPEGARLLDVFTHFAPGSGSFGLATDWKPVDGRPGVFRARWL
jgi:hypothetical protein